MKPIVEIKNISKKFRIHHEKQTYLSLRDSVANLFKGGKGKTSEDFWALKDVSFDVFPGESVGIIGKNGAGKSTLLKILSKITPPTSGKITSRGRLASLLEVGTGFHPELTGRENIFLNGSILGMKRKEIELKFDEIVDFSGVKTFLDTPLKHYSSGMQLRLAFAVSAFLEPEILLIDEILAVGDAEFQKKCLGKMNALTKQEGRTIVFVSHNLLALQNLCTRGIWLDTGTLQYDGNSPETIAAYMSFVSKNSQEKLPTRNDRKGNGKIKIVQIELKDLENKQIHSVTSGQTFDIVFKYVTSEYPSLLTGITFGITLNLINGTCLTLHHNKLIGSKIEVSGTEGIFRARIHELPLNENLYSVTYSIMDGMDYIDSLDNAFEIKVIAGKIYNYLKLPPNSFGSLLLNCEWFNN